VAAIQGDVPSLDDLDKLYAEVAAKKGEVDVLFANAGFVGMVPTADVTPEHFDKTFNIITL
jgi:NAD(P)-dependent dehydrogenase (short-subunit alcohol dehydrogenase family)